MKQRILAATRKGLFAIERGRAGWSVDRVAFLGDNATMVLVSNVLEARREEQR